MIQTTEEEKRQFRDKLIEPKQYIDECSEDLPKIRNWKRSKHKS
jgi:phosphoketolase